MSSSDRRSAFLFLTVVLCISAVMLLPSACKESSSSQQTTSRATVPALRVGYIPYSPTLPFFVALEEKLFEKEGLRVVPVEIKGSSTAIQAMASGDIDISFNNNLGAILPYLAKNPNAFRLTLLSLETSSEHYDYILTRAGIDIGHPREIQRFRIGLRTDAVDRILAGLYFSKVGGFRLDTTTYHELPSATLIQQFQAGELDVAVTVDPDAAVLRRSGKAKLFKAYYRGELVDPFPAAATSVSANLTSARPEDARRFLRAIHRAVALMDADPRKRRDLLPKYLRNLDPSVADLIGLPHYPKSHQAYMPQLKALCEIYRENSIIEAPVDPSKLFWE